MIWDWVLFGDRSAIIDEGGTRITYARLGAEADVLVRAVERRCLVFALCENTVGSVLGYAAFLNAGIVPALLGRRLDQGLLDNLLAAYRPSYIWAPAEEAGRFDASPAYEAWGYCLLKTRYPEEFALHPDLALLLTTSGSTGSPKFVRQSYVNILDNAQAIVKYLELDETERPITTLPMNYTYGLSIINSHFLVGATLLLTEKSITQREFWGFFKEAGATSFGGVPYTYEILDRMRFQKMELPSLRTMTQAGGKLAPELHQKFAEYAAERGKKFIVMYGQAEASPRMGYLPSDKALEKRGAMGIAIPGGKFRLIDEEGQEITSPNVTGELVYEGKNVAMGYAEQGEDLSRGDEWGGVLHTGDMAQFDEEGYYTIVGRKKRFLKIFGNRINLEEAERLLASRGFECACAGEDDLMRIYTPLDRPDEIARLMESLTHLNRSAFKVIHVEKIPRNESGKVLYSELR